MLPVAGDALLEEVTATIGTTWNIDVSLLRRDGLPIIRYLPGAPSVGVHGDIGATGLVPNVTLVLYLTDGEAASGEVEQKQGSGQTFFPGTPCCSSLLLLSSLLGLCLRRFTWGFV